MRVNGERRSPPHPCAPRPERERPRHQAQVGTSHGSAAAQDPRGLPSLPPERPRRPLESAKADIDHWRAGCGESRTSGSEGGRRKSALINQGNSPAAYPTRPGAGGEGVSRHRHQGPVPPRREAFEVKGAQVQPPPKSRKLLPAQRAGQVQDVQHAAHRAVRQERPVLPTTSASRTSSSATEPARLPGSTPATLRRWSSPRFAPTSSPRAASEIW